MEENTESSIFLGNKEVGYSMQAVGGDVSWQAQIGAV